MADDRGSIGNETGYLEEYLKNFKSAALDWRNAAEHRGRTLDLTAVANELQAQGMPVSTTDVPRIVSAIVQAIGVHGGVYFVPQAVVDVLRDLLDGVSANIVCDPWAGLGAIISTIVDATHANKAIAFTKSQEEANLGRILAKNAEWQVGETIQLLHKMTEEIDVAGGILPFGVRPTSSVALSDSNGRTIEVKDDLGHIILALTAQKLSAAGMDLLLNAKFILSITAFNL